MRGSGKKCKKTSIFGHFRPKRAILEVFGQNGQTVKIFKKAFGTFFSHLQALTNCKVSEKSKERFPRKSLAYERTNG